MEVQVGIWEGQVWLNIWWERCEILMGLVIASDIKLGFAGKVFNVGVIVLMSFDMV